MIRAPLLRALALASLLIATIEQPASSTPVLVPGGLTFATLNTGFVSHRCGVTTVGTAYCWGVNYDGELGNGTMTQSSIPVKVAGQP